jgi:hypothetical protein
MGRRPAFFHEVWGGAVNFPDGEIDRKFGDKYTFKPSENIFNDRQDRGISLTN